MWATAEDVLARWVGGDRPEMMLVSTWVDDAEVILNAEIPDLAERAATEPGLTARARIVVVRMVTRALRNPDGLRQFNDQTGPFQVGGTYAGPKPGELVLLHDERAMLAPAPIVGAGNAFTISTVPRRQVDETPWWVTP